jgi:pyoverdine/dityrosine biosynthesis protein Dit1
MRVVIEADSQFKKMLEEIACAIKAKITFEENENEFWDELPTHVQKGILEAKTQVEEGNYKVHEEVMNEYKTRFK